MTYQALYLGGWKLQTLPACLPLISCTSLPNTKKKKKKYPDVSWQLLNYNFDTCKQTAKGGGVEKEEGRWK